MDFSKSKVLLKKINAIHDSVAAFGGDFSSLEKDLILQYIRDLYESINIDGQISETPSTNHQVAPKVDVPVKAVPVVSEVIAKVSTNGSSNGQAMQSISSTIPTAVEELPKQKEKKKDPDLEILFEESKADDLSQRFANAPIKDISKAMGINERILTINELFKGDQQAFQSVADTLNGFSSFAEAKEFLINGIATEKDWASNKRKKKAAVFIKLVRRRYQ